MGTTISPCEAVYLASPDIEETVLPLSLLSLLLANSNLTMRGNLEPDFAHDDGMVENGSLPISRATLQPAELAVAVTLAAGKSLEAGKAFALELAEDFAFISTFLRSAVADVVTVAVAALVMLVRIDTCRTNGDEDVKA
jgi:hypothetical protein